VIKAAGAAICIVFLALFAAPAHAQEQAPTGSCYPPPCAAPGQDAVVLEASADTPVRIVAGGRAGVTSPAPLVGVGLLGVAMTFIALASSRRIVGVGQVQPAGTAPQRLRLEPDRSLR
jgi:hypothetical protein